MGLKTKGRLWVLVLYLAPIMALFASLFVGAYQISPGVVIELLLRKVFPPEIGGVEQSILFDIRIPRIILALLVGAALSVTSACYQACFRNPLVSEYILGVSAGAAFGASLSIAFLGPKFPAPLMAFAGGMLAVTVTISLTSIKRETSSLFLVLAGVITTAVFTAGSYLVRYFAEPERLHVLIVWLMGSFSSASWRDVIIIGPFVLPGILLVCLLGWRLNLLSMGDDEARALGMEVTKMKILLIAISTLITSLAVSTVGIIGWIGLMVPHIIRLCFGSDHRVVIPLSAALGATLMLLADNIIRMREGIELPVGVLTTLLGAPFFAYLIRKSKTGAWE